MPDPGGHAGTEGEASADATPTCHALSDSRQLKHGHTSQQAEGTYTDDLPAATSDLG